MKQNPRYPSQRLETTLRPELALHLTPQMKLHLEILQANILTLEGMLELELQQNPALETIEDAGEEREETEERKDEEVEIEKEARELEQITIDDFYPGSPASIYGEPEEPMEPGQPYCDRSSLEEHMLRLVVNQFADSDVDYQIALQVLQALDDSGFFHGDSEKIASELGTDAERVERIRTRIRFFEPVGIASRDIPEALLTQLLVMGYEEDSPEALILTRCFDSLLQKRITSIAHKLRISQDRAAEAFSVIAGLDPKPGRNFRERPRQTIQPDLTILYRGNRLIVQINESPLPPLRLSRRVREILESPKHYSKEEVDFARRKLEAAQMFIRGILQRRDTLSRMANEILNRNYDYFSARSKQITPLLMKDIAEALDVHSSTISRAVKDKYIETPVGIFPLRDFFSKSEANPVLDKLRKMIAAEDKTDPLTDATIAEKLVDFGIKISRRTVAKYRLKMNIPDRFQRKALAK